MLNSSRLLIRSAIAVIALGLIPLSASADDSLYRAFGGKAGVERVIDDFYDGMLADPRTKTYFEGVSIPKLEKKLNEQFCALLGGPCVYTGRSMKRAHEGLNIDHAAFSAAVDDLKKAMDKNHVPAEAQKKFLAKLMPMARDIQDRE